MKTHFRSLSTQAQGYGLSSGLDEQAWQETFDAKITELIAAVLRYRLELLASGHEHVHTWPNTEDQHDYAEMEIYGAKKGRPLQVAFTVFPGTKMMVPEFGRPGLKATVRV